jgi:hypothetical protein
LSTQLKSSAGTTSCQGSGNHQEGQRVLVNAAKIISRHNKLSGQRKSSGGPTRPCQRSGNHQQAQQAVRAVEIIRMHKMLSLVTFLLENGLKNGIFSCVF